DGLEITQFTYFQQAGGQDLSPISVELTYGLERFAMALQGVDNVYDLQWAPGVPYRDVRLRDDVEQSKYAFGQVQLPPGQFAEFHREMFNKNYDFARALIDSGLVLPALDFCLKCSHLFNILDASGSIGVTERTAYILRVRQLAVAIAKAWAESQPNAALVEGAAHGS
ncbi:MAG: glycine--tRNA ligase subunit alpha, partial [Rhodospirillales bacterium]|nr:glycine--tRNA ligase subunit alpha [Rhodospirillales bacterium]